MVYYGLLWFTHFQTHPNMKIHGFCMLLQNVALMI